MAFLTSLLNSMPGAAAQGLAWGVMAIGVYITYKILDVADLTVDGSLGTGAAVCVLLTINGAPIGLAMACSVLAGMLAGLVTGLLHTACGIPAILSGILTQLALYSVYWFFGTELGCSLRATGSNGNMARAQGINTNLCKVLGLMVSNALVALAGALLAQYQGFADVNMGRGAIVIGLAAVIIGEVLFSKVFRNFALKLLACAIGAVIYYIVIQFVLRLGLSTDDLKLLTALVVALFLAVPHWKGRYFSRAAKPARKGERANA